MDKQTQSAAIDQLIALYERYTKSLSERLWDAHERIGYLEYYLEYNGINVPTQSSQKKRQSAPLATNPKINPDSFSLN